MKRLALGITMICVATMLTGCSNTANKPRNKETVAVVNGNPITLEDVDLGKKFYMDELKDKYGEDFEKGMIQALANASDDENKEKIESEIEILVKQRNITLDSIVEETVMVTKAMQLGLYTKEFEDEAEKQYQKQVELITETSSEKPSTDESMYYASRMQGIQGMKAIYEDIVKDVIVSNEEIEGFYNENIDVFGSSLEEASQNVEGTIKAKKVNDIYKERLDEYSKELKVETYKDKLSFS